MMNKMKSARVHAIRFLFVLPLLFVLLIAFRNRNASNDTPLIRSATIVIDQITRLPLAGVKVVNANTGQEFVTDAKGYYFIEVPADKPINMVMRYSVNGYHSFESHSFSLLKKENRESFNLIEVVEMRKGDASIPCTGCASSIRMEDKIDPKFGFQDALNYKEHNDAQAAQYTDTIPRVRKPNKKGYYIDVTDNNGHCIIVVRDKNKKEVTTMTLEAWKEKESYFEDLYGKIPPPPTPPLPPVAPVGMVTGSIPAPPVPPLAPVAMETGSIPAPPLAPVAAETGSMPPPPLPPKAPEKVPAYSGDDPAMKDFLKRNPEVKNVGWVYKQTNDHHIAIVHILNKDGSSKQYDIRDKNVLAELEKKYGKIPYPPVPEPPTPPTAPVEIKEQSPVSFVPYEAYKNYASSAANYVDTLVWMNYNSPYKSYNKDNATYISADSIQIQRSTALLIINGKEARPGTLTFAKKGQQLKMVTLDKEAAIKKYGDKGRNGAIEVTTT
jgi:hypothetical protein